MNLRKKPNLYVPPLENPELKRGKFAGYCKRCDGILSAMDKAAGGVACPRCGTHNTEPSKIKKKDTSWT